MRTIFGTIGIRKCPKCNTDVRILLIDEGNIAICPKCKFNLNAEVKKEIKIEIKEVKAKPKGRPKKSKK